MMNSQTYDYIQHAGVRGMKWGVRRRSVPKTSSSSSSQSVKKRRMTNKEITSRVKRLKLEQEYAKLTERPKTASKVEKMVKAAGTVATLSGSALTIYKNMNELADIVGKAKK